MTTTWNQEYFVWGQGLAVSALIAAIPTLLLLFLLGVKRKPAWLSGLAALAVTLIVAVSAYGMSLRHALSAAAYGAAFGLFPITWIIFSAILLYRVTVETGQFEIVKKSVGRITSDKRLQVLLIAFAFGAFLEGGAGFGTPVAVAAAMLVGLGFGALEASAICLLANTVPVAFGAIGIPIVTLAGITGLPLDRLSAEVGRVCAPVSFFVPAYLIAVFAGRSAVVQLWPALLVCGGVFAGVQFFVSNYIGAPLTDILSSLLSMGATIVLLRFWHPRAKPEAAQMSGMSRLRVGQPATTTVENADDVTYTSRELLVAWTPYLLLVVFVLAWGYGPIHRLLDSASLALRWPALHNEIRRMPPVTAKAALYPAVFNFNWLAAGGTSCMLAALLSAVLLGMRPKALVRLLASVARQLFLPTLTVTSVLAMAFVMNYCGATGTLGLAFAATGALFPFFSSLLGWLGVFLTGSDTSANALFGNLQVVTAAKLGFSPVLIAASNSAGGVMGKMISLQTIAVAAAATGLTVNDQATLFRFALRHSLFLAGVVGCEVLLYAYAFHAH